MAWVKVIQEAEAEGELAALYGKSQRVANIIKSHSLNVGALKGHLELYRAVMFRPSGLSRAEREAVATVVSSLNACHY
jgi:alkylhydroperoxidase family enzyme